MTTPTNPIPDSALHLLERGQAHRRAGRHVQALADHEALVAQLPRSPQAWSELASSYQHAGSADAAIAGYQQAVRLAPRVAELHYNLGTALQTAARFAEARICLLRALERDPTHRRALTNLGLVLRGLGALPASERVLRHALILEPGHAETEWNLALTLLQGGAYQAGWQLYESRLRLGDFSIRPPDGPRWDGTPDASLRLLITVEQGLGDTLQFVRFLPQIRERVGHVTLRVQTPLRRLLAGTPGYDALVTTRDPVPGFDAWAGLLSLPGFLDAGREALWTGAPYLHAEPELRARWRARLAEWTGLRIGIGWQGNPGYAADGQRSIPLRHFLPLADIPGVTLLSLQKRHGLAQLAALPPRAGVIDLGRELDEDTAPFVDTAAVMTELDLVITSDTATPHLAGGLGVPVWLALPNVPDWRFELKGADCPWYRSMRVFRQKTPGDWAGVFSEIFGELERRVSVAPQRARVRDPSDR